MTNHGKRPDYSRYVRKVRIHDVGACYIVADWDPETGYYRYPLDANQRRATGCTHASTTRLTEVPRYATRRQALRRARTLWGRK